MDERRYLNQDGSRWQHEDRTLDRVHVRGKTSEDAVYDQLRLVTYWEAVGNFVGCVVRVADVPYHRFPVKVDDCRCGLPHIEL